jgi:hypothetical protein
MRVTHYPISGSGLSRKYEVKRVIDISSTGRVGCCPITREELTFSSMVVVSRP